MKTYKVINSKAKKIHRSYNGALYNLMSLLAGDVATAHDVLQEALHSKEHVGYDPKINISVQVINKD